MYLFKGEVLSHVRMPHDLMYFRLCSQKEGKRHPEDLSHFFLLESAVISVDPAQITVYLLGSGHKYAGGSDQADLPCILQQFL